MKTKDKILKAVKSIPKGRVATYGQIAKSVGIEDPRIVGWILSKNNDPNVPCHRVVKKDGYLVKRYAFGKMKEEIRKLKTEKIKFKQYNQVNMTRSACETC